MRCVRQNRSARRGVLLLVVLSLLVLMSMIALAFVMMTGQARRVSNSQSGAERRANADPAKQLDAAFLQIERGTNNKNSAIHESLLEDMYGESIPAGIISTSATTFVPAASWVPSTATSPTQLIDLEVAASNPAQPLATQDGYYNGRLFSALIGGAWQSTRVVGYHHDDATGKKSLRVMAFEVLTNLSQITGGGIINGRPFSGTGFGNFELRTDKFGATAESLDIYSLLPNVKGSVKFAPKPEPTTNEDYDAADAQNMLLAYTNAGNQTIPSLHRPDLVNWWLHKLYDGVIPQPDPTSLLSAPQLTLPDGTPWAITWPNNFTEKDKWATIFNPLKPIPGKPLTDNGQTQRTILAVKKAIICRPLRELNPAFTGSNADSVMPFVLDPASKKLTRYWELYGNWDVDNDGDGVPDSIWVDLGFPVQTGPDGRLYKPLFAIYCIDMDGRLNVNAHGGIAHVDPSYGGSLVPPFDTRSLAGGVAVIAEPRGMGYGTAEISLANLYAGASNPRPDWLLGGNDKPIGSLPAFFFEGRYGESARSANLPYPGASGKLPPFPGDTGVAGPGRLGRMKQFEALLWNAYAAPPQLDMLSQGAYASPHDLYGAGTVLLDKRGQPLNLGMNTVAVDFIHTPYEMDLSRRAVRATRSANSVDSPFTPAELERVLRPFDVDAAALPGRLSALLNPGGTNSNPLHRLVTTDSYDVPTPFALAPREMRQAGADTSSIRSVVDLYADRLRKGMGGNEQDVQRELKKMFSAEWMAGLKLDINRPFGNGGDDNKNGVVDEPGEYAAAQESAWGGVFPGGRPVAFDPSNGLPPVPLPPGSPPGTLPLPPGIVARQQMARQIFTLLMLVRNEQSLFGSDSNGDGLISDTETIDTLAQWAINVVDFRDRDSTMTPFEYDRNPWDGWDVDGDPRTPDPKAGVYRGLVWGCERPELLIDEGFAMHDRRTEDLKTPANTTTDPDPLKRDKNYDQRLRPQGSLFVELYNPWGGLQEMPPGEFDFDQATTQWRPGVVLNKRNVAGDPVWRMLIVRGERKFADPDDPFTNLRPRAAYTAAQFTANTEVERSVYFAGAPPARYVGHGLPYFGNPTKLAWIPPGRYAVIGPAAKTMIGRRTDAQDDPTNPAAPVDLKYNQTRQIVLTPRALPDANSVQVLNNPGEPAAGDLPPAVAVIVDAVPDPADPTKSLPARLSVSEPLGTSWDPFYPTTAAQGWDANAVKDGGNLPEGAWTTPKDEPLDAKRQGDFSELAKNQTLLNFRVIHLQRLADPSLPWNPEPRTEGGQPNPAYNANWLVNPYLTIDSAPVDLTCFNGVTNDDGDPTTVGIHDDAGLTGFASHQRGETNENEAAPKNINNLWRQELPRTKLVVTPPDGGVPLHYFNLQFIHTLGYLNGPYWSTGPSGKYFTNATAPADPRDTAFAKFYAGAPTDTPFRWLNWNNRPYISAHELLLVPKARSSRLLGEYPRLAATAPGVAVPAGYADAPPPVAPTNPFNHLLNFFDAASPRPGGSANLYRLFDYVGVPSRWVGTETMLNLGMNEPYTDSNNNGMWDPGEPYTDTNSNGRCDNVPNDWDYWSMVRAPFNKVSNYRDPGAINVNTVSDWRVWEAIFHGDPSAVMPPANRHAGPPFDQLTLSRRGPVPLTGLPFDVNQDFPSIFMRPFRSAGSGSLGLYVDQQQNAIQSDIEVTLMRPDPNPAAKNFPLFRFMSPDMANDPARNPYFAYQALRRNSNLLTTRSNVYAVWITVGRFEVQPAQNRGAPPFTPAEMRALYPDGYELGPELGSDTGEIVRHRAFYLLDRTIPVGFSVGEDLNVDKAVLVKRYIE